MVIEGYTHIPSYLVEYWSSDMNTTLTAMQSVMNRSMKGYPFIDLFITLCIAVNVVFMSLDQYSTRYDGM